MRCTKVISPALALMVAAGILSTAPAASAETFYGASVAATTLDTQAPTLVATQRTSSPTINPSGTITYSWTVDDQGEGFESISYDVTDAKGAAAGSSTTVTSTTEIPGGFRTTGTTTVNPNRINMKPGDYTVNAIVLADKAGNTTTINSSTVLAPLTVSLTNPDYDDAMPTITGYWTKDVYAPGERAIFKWELTDANVHQSVQMEPRFRLANNVYLRNVIPTTTATQQSGYSYVDLSPDIEYGTTLRIADSRIYDKFNIWNNTTAYTFAEATVNDPAHPVAPVTITGKPGPGQKVTVNTTAWTGATIKTQWNAGLNSKLATLTGSSFTFPTAANGYASNTAFTVKVTGTWPDGTIRTRQLTSFSDIYNTPAVAPGKVGITGTMQVGNKLTGTLSGWPSGYRFIGQWKFADNTPAAPSGETVLHLTAEHANQTLQFCVTGVKAGASSTGTCKTAPIARGNLGALNAKVHWDKGFKDRAVVGDTATLTLPVPKVPNSVVKYSWRIAGVEVPGANSKTFKIPASAAGKAVHGSVVVSAPGYNTASTWANGSTAVTATVGDATIVSGTTRVGATLSAKAGSWTKNTKLSYQWMRNGTPIWGSTKPTYAQTWQDLNTVVTVKVVASRAGAETITRASDPRGKTTAGILPKASFAVTGNTSKIGNILKVTQKAGVVGRSSVKYQWYRNGKPVPGAIWSQYGTKAADVRAYIQVRATVSAPGYSGTKSTTSNTVLVAPGSLKKISAKVTGSVKVGQTLGIQRSSSTTGTHYRYQWFKNGKAIQGATQRTYKVQQNDLGSTLQTRISMSKGGYYNRNAYTQKAKVNGKVQKGATITIKGTPAVGRTITAVYKKSEPGTKYALQWYRNNTPIKGATRYAYKVVAADKGKTLRATMKATKYGFYDQVRSGSIAAR